MFFFFSILSIFLSFHLIYTCKKKELQYPFFLIFIPFLFSLLKLFWISQLEFFFFLLIFMSVSSFFILALFHFVFHNVIILSKLHHRYFYLFGIILYFYLLLLLASNQEHSIYQNTLFSPSILFVIFYLFSLLFKGTIQDKETILKKSFFNFFNILQFSLYTISILFLTDIFNGYINNLFYKVCYSIVLMFPFWYLLFVSLKQNENEETLSYFVHLILFPFFFIGLFDFIVMKETIYSYHTTIMIALEKIGLYSSTIFLFLTMKRFSNPIIYDIFMIMIFLIFIFFLL